MKMKMTLLGLLALALVVITPPLKADATSDAKTFLDNNSGYIMSPRASRLAFVAVPANATSINAAVPVVSSLNYQERQTLVFMYMFLNNQAALAANSQALVDVNGFIQANDPDQWLGSIAALSDIQAWIAANPGKWSWGIYHALAGPMTPIRLPGNTGILNAYMVSVLGNPKVDLNLMVPWLKAYLPTVPTATAQGYLATEIKGALTLPQSTSRDANLTELRILSAFYQNMGQ